MNTTNKPIYKKQYYTVLDDEKIFREFSSLDAAAKFSEKVGGFVIEGGFDFEHLPKPTWTSKKYVEMNRVLKECEKNTGIHHFSKIMGTCVYCHHVPALLEVRK